MYIRGLIYASLACLAVGQADAQILSVTTEAIDTSQAYSLNADNLVVSNVVNAPIVQNNQIIGQTAKSDGTFGWDPYGTSGVAAGSQWVSVGGSGAINASATYTIPGTGAGTNQLSFVWGSPSASNTVTLLENNTVVGQVDATGNGNLYSNNQVVASGLVNSPNAGDLVTITTASAFNTVVFSETYNNGGFEVGGISVAAPSGTFNTTPSSVNPAPLPTLAATPLGLMILAGAAFLRRKKLARMARAV